jgi:hypothetical protein
VELMQDKTKSSVADVDEDFDDHTVSQKESDLDGADKDDAERALEYDVFS